MSARMDVLAVLDAQARHTRQFGGAPSFQTVEQARAAIAKLIDEARRCCDGVGDLADLRAALRACGGGE